MKLLSRIAAGHQAGLGHLRPCVVLATEARERDIPGRLIIHSDLDIGEFVNQFEFKTDVYKNSTK
jgi:hypothetical protein